MMINNNIILDQISIKNTNLQFSSVLPVQKLTTFATIIALKIIVCKKDNYFKTQNTKLNCVKLQQLM